MAGRCFVDSCGSTLLLHLVLPCSVENADQFLFDHGEGGDHTGLEQAEEVGLLRFFVEIGGCEAAVERLIPVRFRVVVVDPLHPLDLAFPVLLVELVYPHRELVVIPGHPE